MPANFIIEEAPSARSTCKKCKEKLPKGILRIANISESSDSDMVFKSYYHTSCFSIPKSQEIKDVAEWCDAILVDETEHQIMSKEKERVKIIADIMSKIGKSEKPSSVVTSKSSSSTTTSSKATTTTTNTKLEKFKAVAEQERGSKKKKKKHADEKDANDEPTSKKIKLTKEEEAEYDIYSMYSDMSVDALHDVLRWNLQLVAGNKSVLLARVTDGHLRGRLTRCPLCTGGKIAIRDEVGMDASCNGYFDEDKGIRISCSFKAPVEKCPRIHPWFAEKPTDEEMEDIKQKDLDTKAGKSASSKSSTEAIKVLLGKIKKLEWKTTTKADIKASTAAMVAILKDGEVTKVDLPEGRETMAVGKIVAANQSKSSEEVFTMIVEQYGFADDSKANDAQRIELLETTCIIPANAPILMVLLELKNVYDKEGNSQAGRTYNHVADAIKNLDFEVTTANVMAMSKGKTKVAGIGKSSAEKIKEFLETGKITKLEEKRAAQAV